MNTPVSALLERKSPIVHSVSPTTCVAEAVDEMNRHKIGSLIVLDGDKLVGIFTERDVLQRVVGSSVDPRQSRVADVMTKDLMTIAPSTSVEEAMALFTDRRCRHLPVLEAGKLLGVVSIGDATRWMVDSHRMECEHLKNYIGGGFPA